MEPRLQRVLRCAGGLLSVAAVLSLCAFDWPCWRGPDGNGISRETAWNPKALSEGRVLWKATVGRGYSNIVILDGRLYCAGATSVVQASCFDAGTGGVIWTHDEDLEWPMEVHSTPVVDTDGVYILDHQGTLLCLDPRKGSLKWKKDLTAELGGVKAEYGFSSSPVVVGDLLVLTYNTSGLALDKKTGEKVWLSEEPPLPSDTAPCGRMGIAYSTPVVYEKDGKKLAVICSWKGIHSVEPATGNVVWKYDWHEVYKVAQIADPIYFDDRLFIVQYWGQGYEDLGAALLDVGGKGPRVLWRENSTCSNTSSPVMIGGNFYVCWRGPDNYRSPAAGTLRCLDGATGAIRWEEPLDKRPISMIAADGKLIILSDKGMLYIAEASPRVYKEISRYNLQSGGKIYGDFLTPPVLCNGRLYVKNGNGQIRCLDLR
jgi:outer membrane protein assembly factor BamB